MVSLSIVCQGTVHQTHLSLLPNDDADDAMMR
jgi:hypothetical protein